MTCSNLPCRSTSPRHEAGRCQPQTNPTEERTSDSVEPLPVVVLPAIEKAPRLTTILQNTKQDKENGRVARKRVPSRSAPHSESGSGISKRRREVKPHQFTEEKLFELLIGKIRTREEREAAVADMQQRLHTENVRLKEENRELQEKNEIYEGRLGILDAESRSYRSQINGWKERVSRFKKIVNDLGRDYENLRADTERFKTTATALQNDRSDILNSINNIKLQILRAEESTDEQRSKVSDSEKQIAVLQREVLASREREGQAKSALAEEKRRNGVLESYVQNYSRNHMRQLKMIRSDHSHLLDKLMSALDSISEGSENSRDTVLSEMRSCFDSMAIRLSDHEKSVTNANVDVSHSIQENTRLIGVELGPASKVVEQLGLCNKSHEALMNTLGVVSPTLSELDTSVKTLAAGGNHLVHELKNFGTRLDEIQLHANNQELATELSAKFSENTQLQIRLHDTCSDLENIRVKLHEREAENQKLERLVTESGAKCQSLEHQKMQVEAENTCLKRQVESSKEDARKLIDEEIASSRTGMQDEYEEQLRVIRQEKGKIETSSEMLASQLEDVQKSLKKAEAQKLIDDQKRERVSLVGHSAQGMTDAEDIFQVRESEERIRQLTDSNSLSMAQVSAQTEDIKRFQESEAASCIERDDLQEQLRLAHEKVHELEQKSTAVRADPPMTEPFVGNIVPFSAVERQLASQRGASLCYEPADFAMLFMSDEMCPSSPYNVEGAKKSVASPEKTSQQGKEPQKHQVDIAEKIVEPSSKNQSPVRSKRKAVNFKSQKLPTDITEQTSSTKSILTKVEHEPEDRPSKVTKHVHKWTYSRIRSTGPDIQREQSAGPSHVSVVERRTSPKGLVSANSGQKAPTRGAGRGRGKRRSRGRSRMKPSSI
ncbi:hypothetical protein N7532_008838 [Penicillium argentinense]|uniref:Uncharacterized protein n=1 Tax=Penicillium argentinense TaxID=1131581 RepID=A0A9W9EY64_9EURO|nr:uncharacterized protein N7532_008838 [Penicillium argentinense]KAJ5090154.1 hypothetical protein N7532_008838 [Penicillium argentinense]